MKLNLTLVMLLSTVSILNVTILLNSTYAQEENTTALQQKIVDLEAQIDAFEKEKEIVEKNIALFDKMDLDAFTNQDMDVIKEIHADDVRVYNPDGSLTIGMTPEHEREIQWIFDTYPDIKITEHPIKFGSGNWTAGISTVNGTWTEPMILEDGTILEPTGKSFEIKMATIAKWNNEKIEEEYLFWDNVEWNKQVGIGN
ncbi:MAG: ester cyclase [Nitrososphaeraceae archaeon]